MDYKKPTGAPLGDDRLLSISDIQMVLGCCPETASAVIQESGYGLKLHRRRFILRSNLLKYFHSLEVA